MSREIDPLKKLHLVTRLALNKKAESIKVLDMRPLSNFCDFFIIMTVSSGRHAQAIIDAIRAGLDKKQVRIKQQEGSLDSPWILLDLSDIVIHFFNSQSREFYNLDRLWADAPVMKFPPRKNAFKPLRRTSRLPSSKSAARKLTPS